MPLFTQGDTKRERGGRWIAYTRVGACVCMCFQKAHGCSGISYPVQVSVRVSISIHFLASLEALVVAYSTAYFLSIIARGKDLCFTFALVTARVRSCGSDIRFNDLER